MRKILVTLAVLGGTLALAACASQPHGTASQKMASQDQDKMVCFKSVPTGSHVAKMHCMTVGDYKAYKKAQQEASEKDRATMEANRNTHARPRCGSGEC